MSWPAGTGTGSRVLREVGRWFTLRRRFGASMNGSENGSAAGGGGGGGGANAGCGSGVGTGSAQLAVWSPADQSTVGSLAWIGGGGASSIWGSRRLAGGGGGGTM